MKIKFELDTNSDDFTYWEYQRLVQHDSTAEFIIWLKQHIKHLSEMYEDNKEVSDDLAEIWDMMHEFVDVNGLRNFVKEREEKDEEVVGWDEIKKIKV